ncbi:transposase [Marispirochaeta sp.]|uniref:transposase n=1 Tax=Marispirochaeta sp. TaxID=2038653 RepID=UPI00374829BA
MYSRSIDFSRLWKKRNVVSNDAEASTSDGGLVILHQIEKHHRILARLADCFQDHRHQSYTGHSVLHVLTQRIFGICQGYEDLNDHDEWRKIPCWFVRNAN